MKTAEALKNRFCMTEHPENGCFLENHYPHTGSGRAASGSIYYYVAPGESTQFHVIDCDEYWCHTAGVPLEIWMVSPDQSLTVRHLGTEDGCEPMIYIPKGVMFASRNVSADRDGTFLTCITVPRFSYAGFALFSEDEVLRRCPSCKPFFPVRKTNG